MPEATLDTLHDPLLAQLSWTEGSRDPAGSVRIPVWLVGPLRVNGLHARGDYAVPLATTDPGLIERCQRGGRVVTEGGGAAAMVLDEGIGPAFTFGVRTLQQAALFAHWVTAQVDALRRVAAAADREATLSDVRVTVEGNRVHVYLEFTPGDAPEAHRSSAESVRAYIQGQSPVRHLADLTDEGGAAGGASPAPLVRGRRVSAEVIVRVPVVGRAAAGCSGAPQAFVAPLSALFLACGQDLAAVPPSAAAIVRREVTPQGDLYAAVTLPSLIVGTVGGGTALPTQRACLESMGLAGPGKSAALAEVCAALCLAAELGDLPAP